uniref:Uncharacterized protein n=1 Tax=viral metagenome TaxID=1070528 RepID=A0A6C0E0T1_9ZZZZ
MQLDISDNQEYMDDELLNDPVSSFQNNNVNSKINVIKKIEPPLVKPILKRHPLANHPVKPPSISYEDLLNNMGLYIDNDNGQLQTITNTNQPQNQNPPSIKRKGAQVKMECSKVKGCKSQQQNVPVQPVITQNSYIYNKYFKEHLKQPEDNPVIPKTAEEYKQLIVQKLIEKRIQQLRVSQMKSTKLIMPTNNIHISPMNINHRVTNINLNRLFKWKLK